jgi:hypothetical protein
METPRPGSLDWFAHGEQLAKLEENMKTAAAAQAEMERQNERSLKSSTLA